MSDHRILSELGCKLAHLALAWVAKQPNTSTVILGASRPEQVVDNLKAIEVIPKLTPEILERIEAILENKPAAEASLESITFLSQLTFYASSRCLVDHHWIRRSSPCIKRSRADEAARKVLIMSCV